MDLVNLVLNFLLITMLGLLIAFSPMMVIVNLLVVLKSSRPILRTVILMAGMIVPLLVVAALAALFLEPTSQISLRGLSDKLNIPPLIDLLLGVWLLVLAYRRWLRSKSEPQNKKISKLIMKKPPDGLPALFVFAFVKSTLSVSNLFAILVLCKMLVVNAVKQPAATLAILWVILIGLIPFGVILYFYFFKHEKLDSLSSQIDRLLTRNVDSAITIALAAAGLFFTIKALTEDILR